MIIAKLLVLTVFRRQNNRNFGIKAKIYWKFEQFSIFFHSNMANNDCKRKWKFSSSIKYTPEVISIVFQPSVLIRILEFSNLFRFLCPSHHFAMELRPILYRAGYYFPKLKLFFHRIWAAFWPYFRQLSLHSYLQLYYTDLQFEFARFSLLNCRFFHSASTKFNTTWRRLIAE